MYRESFNYVLVKSLRHVNQDKISCFFYTLSYGHLLTKCAVHVFLECRNPLRVHTYIKNST